jgi:hypothetical protein
MKRRAHWTTGEILLVREMWPARTRGDIEKAIPRHTFVTIRDKARELHIRRYTRCKNWLAVASRHVPTFEFAKAVTP